MSFGEIIFALGIISIILVSLIATFFTGFAALQKCIACQEATVIAKRTIEEYKSMEYVSVPIYNPPVITTEKNLNVEISINEGLYVSTDLKYKKVTVSVYNSISKKSAKNVSVTMSVYLYPCSW
ncbi:MAG: hypothetical protein ABRQ38_02700 [Candidatus Eremiobacterota bacterium]